MRKTSKDLVTFAEYARRRGCSRAAVTTAIKTGRIRPVIDPRGRRRIDPKAADRQWQRNSGAVPGEEASYSAARGRRELVRAQIDELQLRKLKGELLDGKDVLREWASIIADCRARLLAIPSSVAPQLEHAKSAAECEAIVRAALYAALEELSRTPRYGSGK